MWPEWTPRLRLAKPLRPSDLRPSLREGTFPQSAAPNLVRHGRSNSATCRNRRKNAQVRCRSRRREFLSAVGGNFYLLGTEASRPQQGLAVVGLKLKPALM